MLSKKLVAAAAAVVLAAAASGCASSGPAERHQHLRDAKQGPAVPQAGAETRLPRKPLHDHREMK